MLKSTNCKLSLKPIPAGNFSWSCHQDQADKDYSHLAELYGQALNRFFAVEVGSTPNTDEKCWSAHDLNTFTMILGSWGLINPDSLRGLPPNSDDLILQWYPRIKQPRGLLIGR